MNFNSAVSPEDLNWFIRHLSSIILFKLLFFHISIHRLIFSYTPHALIHPSISLVMNNEVTETTNYIRFGEYEEGSGSGFVETRKRDVVEVTNKLLRRRRVSLVGKVDLVEMRVVY